MPTEEAIYTVLRTINDPEMPISIVDLGIVDKVQVEPAGANASAKAVIEILPTFVGCPALEMLEKQIRQKVGALEGVSEVAVHFKFDPPWTVGRISKAGREALRHFGVTVPGEADLPPACPFCSSANVRLESSFGPTRCRMIYHCESCRSPFEHMKKLSLPLVLPSEDRN